jgi:hypothetical protein
MMSFFLDLTERFPLKNLLAPYTGEACPGLEPGAGIQLNAFTFRMALKRFISCPASAGMTDLFC